MEGYFEGVLDIYYAPMTTEETATAPPVYDVPKVLASTIETTITPTYREGELRASNVTKRKVKKIDTYQVKLNLDKIPQAIKAELLGRKVDANGVQIIKGSNNPIKVAIGFANTLDDGSKELWWLYKGEFAEPTQTSKTRGQAVEYQTPTLDGVFVRRADNDDLAAVVETSDDTLDEAVVTGWFTEVYEEDLVIPADPPEGP